MSFTVNSNLPSNAGARPSGDAATAAPAGTGAAGSDWNAAVGPQIEQMLRQLLQQLLQLLQQFSGQAGGTGDAASPPMQAPAPAAPSMACAAPAPARAAAQAAPPAGNSGATGTAGAAAPAGASPDISGMSPAQGVATKLRAAFPGITDQAVAAILGNLKHESGLSGDINQGGVHGAPDANNADDNAHGWGLAQWGGERKEAVLKFCAGQGKPPGDLGAQTDFLIRELKGPYKNVMDGLQGETNLGAAVSKFCTGFEGATDPQMGSRVSYAQQFMQQGL